ncbi:TraB family protein [Candidatus Woesearchaeota archaeon]|nr:TraB family protein [Candidatus Woesearchaeota archaeon]
MNKLILIGTSHIAQQSIQEIEKTIQEQKPDLLALELDPQRFQALITNQKSKVRLSDVSRIGFKGFLFAAIGAYIQKKLGKMVGTAPGSEMLTAIKQAKKHQIPIALIDQDIAVTLRRFSQTLTWKERFRFIADLFKGIFTRKKQLEKLGNIDLTKVPPKELVKKLIGELKQRYPNIYKVLVEERNQIMIRNLKYLFQENPDKTVLAVVGAGHQDAIEQAFKSKTI